MERTDALAKLKTLAGQELHVLAEHYGVTIYKDGRVNKGWAGHVFERFLELPINSAQSPNFGSWELKSVPLRHDQHGRLRFKETMAITMIDPVNVCQKEFADSHLLAKLQKAVVVVRVVGRNVDEPSYIHSAVEFDLTGDIYDFVKADYDLVRNACMDPNRGFSSLSGEMGYYVQPRTKGAGHGSITRAFYARPRFLAKFIEL